MSKVKNRPYWRMLVDALLISCGVLAAVLAVPSSYGVKLEIVTLVYTSVLFSFLLSAILHFVKKPLVPILIFLFAATVYVILDRSSIKSGLKIIYYAIMKPPSSIFPFLPVPKDPAIPELRAVGCVTSLLVAAAAVYSVLISLAVIKSSSPLPAILVLLPTVFLSMVYTDCSPALHAVMLLVIYLGGVLLGNGVGGATKKHAMVRLVFLLLITVLAFALRAISPEKEYVPIPYEQRQYILGERFGRVQDGILSIFSSNPKEYGLGSINDRLVNDSKAFSISSTVSGSFLMRTHSYGLYRNNGFTVSPEYSGEWQSLHALGATQSGSVETISVQGALTNERIVPYAFSPDSYVKVEEGFVRAYGETSYSWKFKPELLFTPIKSEKAESDYYLFALNNYTMAGGEQKEDLIKLMDKSFPVVLGIAPTFSEYVKYLMRTDYYQAALAVAEKVRGIGEYSLTPGATPGGRDLVEFFVSENKKGYCVHYASTTAAFLQALNIPARFVIGYRVDIAKADEWQDITKDASHAWVEVYIKGVGWVPIECTPGFGSGGYAPAHGDSPLPTPTPAPTPTPDPNAPTPDVSETELPDIEKPSRDPRATATPKPTNTPGPGGSGGIGGGKGGGAMLWLLIALGAIALWLIVGFVIDRVRNHRFEQSDPNAAVLCMLRYLRRLERFGFPPEPEAKELGEEAAFSNHSMSAKQKELIARCTDVRRSAFKNKPLKRMLLRRLIFML
ncbi:MAG: hypothetical protein IKZ82_05005 [Clostridia bacterium]|nr:hypothetical protein [Clostridia bacterium]